MKRSNRLVILVGVLLAVLAFVGIVILLNQGDGPERPEPTTVTVIVAIDDIAIGDPVTPDMAETAKVAADAVEQTAHWRPVAADRHARHWCPSRLASRSPRRRPA